MSTLRGRHNHAYDGFPVWGMCTYDTRITSGDVLADVAQTHPYLATPDGRHVPNADFEDPANFLTRRPPAGADPLEASPPSTELVDPTPAVARRTVRNAARAGRLDPDELEGLVFDEGFTVRVVAGDRTSQPD